MVDADRTPKRTLIRFSDVEWSTGNFLEAMVGLEDLIGLAAGTLTTCSFLPQVIHTWRSRSARDISFTMFSLFSLGVVLWLVYGVLMAATPIIVANAITLVLALAILAMKLRFG